MTASELIAHKNDQLVNMTLNAVRPFKENT
jgi:hypothetical protein